MLYDPLSVLYRGYLKNAASPSRAAIAALPPVEVVHLCAVLMAEWDTAHNPRRVVHKLKSATKRKWTWTRNEPLDPSLVTPDTFDASQQTDVELSRQRFFRMLMAGACDSLAVCLLTVLDRLEKQGRRLVFHAKPVTHVHAVESVLSGFDNPLIWDRFADGWGDLVPTFAHDQRCSQHRSVLIETTNHQRWAVDLSVAQFGREYETVGDCKQFVPPKLELKPYWPLSMQQIDDPDVSVHRSIGDCVREVHVVSPRESCALIDDFWRSVTASLDRASKVMRDYYEDEHAFQLHLIDSAMRFVQ